MTKEQWKEIFAGNLIDILEEKGMTQAELAMDAELPKSQISEYINGNSMPSLAAAITMSYALDMELGDLVDFGERVK